LRPKRQVLWGGGGTKWDGCDHRAADFRRWGWTTYPCFCRVTCKKTLRNGGEGGGGHFHSRQGGLWGAWVGYWGGKTLSKRNKRDRLALMKGGRGKEGEKKKKGVSLRKRSESDLFV